MSELEQQNEELRRVIRHMRRDIETLGNQAPASVSLADQPPAATDSPSLTSTDIGLLLLLSISFKN